MKKRVASAGLDRIICCDRCFGIHQIVSVFWMLYYPVACNRFQRRQYFIRPVFAECFAKKSANIVL